MPNADEAANAGVHFPPPLVYVIGLAIGWLLQRWIPLPITNGPSRIRLGLALLFAFAYLAIFVGAFTAFRRARTTLIPNRPAAAFVSAGPYRWTRNPMYLSLVCLYLAISLWLDTWWAIVLLPVVVIVIDRTVIGREERYLGSRFPGEYEAYRSRVRRWF